jgi:4-hydroxy-tetrahydrodipicolinate synthase
MSRPLDSGPCGVFAAALTPLTQALEPDAKAFVAHCRWLLAHGCDGLAPLGTTGEANSLSVAQRLAIIDTLSQADLPMDRMIVGTGSCALADAVALSRAANQAGVAGVLLLPPFYYKNPTEDGLFAFFSEVVQRVGDRRLRIYLYHFPALSTVPITLALVARLMVAYPGSFAGIKDSTGDWSVTSAFIKEFPGWGVFTGTESLLLPTLRAGGVGCISATANVSAHLAQAVFADWRSDQAEARQELATAVRQVLSSYPAQAALKQIAASIHRDPGWLNILAPNRPLNAEQAEELLRRLAAYDEMRAVIGNAVTQ